ncbi:terpene cyclase/mutase family protein [Stieleria sp. TO1_6]|uniref:prenyltransferase/squalene oxidase repeat-containing protein n=1 Tax=Stieleria tagensis TaxID=2956795 RepID=UPI00209B3DBA|nr:prenyltransferase/squalene oxidase repeat-containing protein [Stieleria tagensis]MCO8120741.1 terpene cyclase/mutase family protein [Stieleria tagensis]
MPVRNADLNRRKWMLALSGILTTTLTQRSGAADPESVENLYVDDQLDLACERAAEFLINNQNSSGSITDRGHEVALTSLAIMALASLGIEPSEPSKRGRALQSALDFVLDPKHQNKLGYFGEHDGSRMYGHGIVTLMLTEMLGMGATIEQNVQIHQRLEKSLRLILSSQAVRKERMLVGGWRYSPQSHDSDLSVTIWQLMALRSAKNDGMDIPSQAIDSALDYLRNSFTGRRNGDTVGEGGFSYTPGQSRPSFTMTAAGLLAMQVCGQYDAPEVTASADWLLTHQPKANERYLFYGLYYYAQGMHQVGGKYADDSSRVVSTLLLPRQRRDGSWMSPGGEERNVGMVYSTSLALLSLSVRYHYLPIYQR